MSRRAKSRPGHWFSTSLELTKEMMQPNNSKTNSTCQRCNQPFVCNAADIAACDCSKIQLSFEETQYIAKQYSNCVCNTCLLHLKDEFLEHK